MLFSDHNGEWQPIPSWVRFLINVGYEWSRSGFKPRRIALISMPCDSAAAGMITLGAMVRDLTDRKANDVDGHYDKLLQYARQYLESCSHCEMACNPQLKRCGYSKKATGRLRSPSLPHRTVTISDATDGHIVWLQPDGPDNQCRVRPTPQTAKNYHIEDEPPAQWNHPNGALSPEPYQRLIENVRIDPDCLRQSYSGLCFAGRTAGERASLEICATTRFREGSFEYGLNELLTIHDWSNAILSRVAFFNPRTEQLDRNNATLNLVIADGEASFLKAIDYSGFQRSDIIGIIQRNIKRDRLEEVGAKIQPNQWFAADTDKLCELPAVPRGINIAILKERGA